MIELNLPADAARRTNRELHEEAAGMALADSFFTRNGIDPDGYQMDDAALADAIKRACAYYQQAGRVGSAAPMLAKGHVATADKIIAAALRARSDNSLPELTRLRGEHHAAQMEILALKRELRARAVPDVVSPGYSRDSDPAQSASTLEGTRRGTGGTAARIDWAIRELDGLQDDVCRDVVARLRNRAAMLAASKGGAT